jgi:hypothetical protein
MEKEYTVFFRLAETLGKLMVAERQRDELVAYLREASDAAIAYDSAIQSCANEPERMASFCTADGDNLETLYAKFICGAQAGRSLLSKYPKL